MKVVVYHDIPFWLAHGGTQELIQELMKELTELGIEVEHCRWWDDRQRGDVTHFFGRPNDLVADLTRQKGCAVVMTELHDQAVGRSRTRLLCQRIVVGMGRRFVPRETGRLGWGVHGMVDAAVYAVPQELELSKFVYGLPPGRGIVIPHGLRADVMEALRAKAITGDYLLSVGTIHPRKNSLLLARLAEEYRVPVVFVGKPYSEDRYYQAFRETCQEYARYAGCVGDEEKWKLLREAKGFVLLSLVESGCIALYEAGAAGLPMLVPRHGWTSHLEANPMVRRVSLSREREVGRALREFWESAARTDSPSLDVLSWRQVAERYVAVYLKALSGMSNGR